MHDQKWIRENPEGFDQALAKRHLAPLSSKILALDEEYRAALTQAQTGQSRRNALSKEIGMVKSKGGNADDMMKEVGELKESVPLLEQKSDELLGQLQAILEVIPNLLADDVVKGKDENDNVVTRTFGEPTKFDFAPKAHDDLGEELGLMDFEHAAQMSGARFVILKGALSRLERALASFMLDTHREEFGYTEMQPPFLVRSNAMYGTGQLPKFAEDLFRTTNDYWLIPTAEVSLTNIVADQILDEEKLPLRMTAYTPCFRSEAGSAGRDTKGMLRQHQFTKVELVSIVKPEESVAEHERMTKAAENILQKLKLPYRVMMLCSGDTGFSARKTYDIEVWLPSQNMYREISSCSNCGDFQARRMKARYKSAATKTNEFVHTLNGSGLAVGRTLVAVLENYQQKDGSIIVPQVLRPYLGGLEKICAS